MSTCYADPNPTYMPAMRLIENITRAKNAEVTTTFAHGYLSGAKVRLYVPRSRGMFQADLRRGTITVTGDTTFTIDIDTRGFNAFDTPVDPSPLLNTCAQVVPVGEINSKLNSAVENVRG